MIANALRRPHADMAIQETKPVSANDVPQVDGAIAVGEDLAFQRRWWRFEKIVWTFFILVLVADLLGLLGRGPLANAKQTTQDGSLQLKYERVLRENTSSILTLLPGQNAVQNGKVTIHVSNEIVKELGAQRVIPQPEQSIVGEGGVTYVFAASADPIILQIELKPSFIGTHAFQIDVPGHPALNAKSFVLP